MPASDPRPVVQRGAVARRRSPEADAPRTRRITAVYTDAEFKQVTDSAAAARLKPSAYVALASLRGRRETTSSAPVPRSPVGTDGLGGDPGIAPDGTVDSPVMEESAGGSASMPMPAEYREALLLELIEGNRQLRRAGVNLNQAVAKLHALGEPAAELAVVAEMVRRAATRVDNAAATVVMRRSRR